MKSLSMQLPDSFSYPTAQGITAIVCWIMAYHVPGHLLSVFSGFDMFLTIALKLLGGAATMTTIMSFYFKNEVRIKKLFAKLKRKK